MSHQYGSFSCSQLNMGLPFTYVYILLLVSYLTRISPWDFLSGVTYYFELSFLLV